MFKLWYKLMCKMDMVDKYDDKLNICDIIRGSVGTIGILAVLAFFIGLVGVLGVSGILAPLIYFGIIHVDPKFAKSTYETASICYVIIVFFGLIYLRIRYVERKEKLEYENRENGIEEEPSMFSLAYKSFKEKTCFTVDVKKYK